MGDQEGNSLIQTEEPPPKTRPQGRLLNVEGVGPDKIVYNLSRPFSLDGKTYHAARSDRREVVNEGTDSQTIFLQEKDGVLFWDDSAPTFDRLQDPQVAVLRKPRSSLSRKEPEYQILVSGVMPFPRPTQKYPNGLSYRTIFFLGDNLQNLDYLVESPDRMKDMPVEQLSDDSIVLFTRPEIEIPLDDGDSEWKRHIRYIRLESVYDLPHTDFRGGKELSGIFDGIKYWGGTDAVFELGNGCWGLLVHKGHEPIKNLKKRYIECFCVVDPESAAFTRPELYVERSDFPKSGVRIMPDKPEDYLQDVVFCCGGRRNNDGTLTSWYGLSDHSPGVITAPDPFVLYETLPKDQIFDVVAPEK